jgi:hypothetical protein
MTPKGIAITGAVILALLVLPVLLVGGDKVTMSNYNSVQMGMSYSQVSKILGEGTPAEEMDQKEMQQRFQMPNNMQMPQGMPDGVEMPDMNQLQGMMENFMKMKVYIWEKGEDAGVAVGFADDRAIMKSQSGLNGGSSYEMEGMGSFDMPAP